MDNPSGDDSSRPAWPMGYPCWIDLGTNDRPDAWRFYREVLGWSVSDTGASRNHYGLASNSAGLVAAIGDGPVGAPPAWTVFFAVPDADAASERITAAGGAVLLPAGDVGEQGRLAVAQDPGGALFGIWQGGASAGFASVRGLGAPSWFDLVTDDPATARRFYGEVLGWQYQAIEPGEPDRYSGVLGESPSGMIAGIGQIMPDDDAPARWRVYFSVQDADAAAERVLAAGGTLITPPESSPYGRLALARDAQGASFIIIDHSVAMPS